VKRALTALVVLLVACTKPEAPAPPPTQRPSILLVTLDTTRADAIGPATPSFNALATRGMRFRYAYATTPQTLPSHSSMLTGLYPGGHGVHENGRHLDERQALLSEQLKGAGYRTAAFVSSFALARRFGLARGFDVYDDEMPQGVEERSAQATTDRVLSFLEKDAAQPLFVWVHYYDPHYPYAPPQAYRDRFPDRPYLGEVAAMDEQLGRLARAFEQRAKGPVAIVVVADHGEGLGEHGEAQHGNLLYQSTMHVPLLVIAPDVKPGVNDKPVSTRRVFHTIAALAGLETTQSLHGPEQEKVVAGEALKPFLDYGWQPQVMAVEGTRKAIFAGRLEVYDVVADPAEAHDLAATADVSREVRATLREYPIPSLQSAANAAATPADEEERRKLASLGYVASEVKPVIRADAPRPADMTAVFPLLDRAAGLFVREQYAQAIPLLEQILGKDPHNLGAALRLATAYSTLGKEREALDAFRRAQAIAPQSPDVQTYLALHTVRGKDWEKAAPMLEQIVAQSPERVPAVEALAVVRERQRRFEDALALRQQLYALRTPNPAELAAMGELAMNIGRTDVAIDAFEKARAAGGDTFRNDLELGVLYLAARRYAEARDALDRVPRTHPGYAMALFKRAQVSVLLREPDAVSRIEAARQHSDATTRELIARERLFQ
jgi:choline-sulfatase